MERDEHEVAAPVALYEGPRITFFRGWRLIMLVAACVGVGVALHAALASWQRSRIDHLEVAITAVPPAPAPAAPTASVAWPMTLAGPTGNTVTLSGVAVVHVWLQGCQDCMPAFEAIKRIGPVRFAGATLYNVAYGSADPAWAQQWGVDHNLAVDDGSHLVRPLGIGTFTTFVIDEAGVAQRVGSPADQGYAEHLRLAVEQATPKRPTTPTAPSRIAEALGYLRGRSGELRGCIEWRRGTTATFRVSLGVAPDGALVDVRGVPWSPAAQDGASIGTAACVERALRGWNIGSGAPERADLLVQVSMGDDDREE